MRSRLTWLIVISGIAMMGIILLQFFWLRNAVNQQKQTFLNDVENAMAETIVNSEMVFHQDKDSLSGQLVSQMINAMLKSGLGNKVSVYYGSPDGGLQNADSLNIEMDKAGNRKYYTSANTITKKEFEGLKASLAKSLKTRKINTPFEFSVLNKQAHFIFSSSDTNTFKNIPIKSSLNELSGQELYLQAAFPQGQSFYFKSMIWIIALSIMLVMIYMGSFFYIIKNYFKEKKLAVIRNDFMNNMTHELKTPISSISIALELMQQENRPNDSKKANYFNTAQSELNRLAQLVDKVLRISAFDKSEVDLLLENIPIAPWLEGIANAASPVIEKRGGTLHIENHVFSGYVYGDKTHLTNLMQCLIDNAIKYNDKEHPVVTIKALENDRFTIFEVKDNGPGIDAAYRTKIFDRFFRIPTGNRHDVKGYGLGLSYVKAIVDLHKGIVDAEPGLEAGTTFRVQIPKKI